MEEKAIESLTENGTYYFPEALTQHAKDIDFLHGLVAWVSAALFIGVVGAAVYFSIKYRKTKKNPVASTRLEGNLKLEITWTIIPFVLVMILFVWGARDFLKANIVPTDALEINVVGQKWNWVFFYPEGFQTPSQLVVPAGRDVKLVMNSTDVLHSFFIPNLRLKRDVLPNRYTTIVFKTDREGAYQVFCTEYCGDQHSTMLAKLTVVSPIEYAAFVAENAALVDIPPVELGMRSYQSYGCNACHSLDGQNIVGPTWLGLYGKERVFTDGTKVLADENYLRESIIMPQAKIVAGYNNVMPSFGYLSDKEIAGLIAYIKTIQP
ncbi:cytochrome c oxidase subunit 2 [Spirochaetota bacterium]|nr:cytochrome c oxidase subunit 2 [Spirochaetota bacterium]